MSQDSGIPAETLPDSPNWPTTLRQHGARNRSYECPDDTGRAQGARNRVRVIGPDL